MTQDSAPWWTGFDGEVCVSIWSCHGLVDTEVFGGRPQKEGANRRPSHQMAL